MEPEKTLEENTPDSLPIQKTPFSLHIFTNKVFLVAVVLFGVFAIGLFTFFSVRTKNFTLGASATGTFTPTTIGLYDPIGQVFYLRRSNTAGPADIQTTFVPATPSALPIAGNFQGDGTSEYGFFDPSPNAMRLPNPSFHINYDHSHPTADLQSLSGVSSAASLPIVGDWNGNGTWGVGVYDQSNSTFYLKNSDLSGSPTIVFQFGPVGQHWLPIAGDWTGSGKWGVGLYNPVNGVFYLKNTLSAGNADTQFRYGPTSSTWLPIAGDWDGNGTWTVGLYNQATGIFYLRNSNTAGNADMQFQYGPIGKQWLPVVGSWPVSTALASRTQDVLGSLHHILIDGQSLALGAAGAPQLTIAQPFHNLGLSDGKFVPLIESKIWQTIASSFANSITNEFPSYQFVITNNALSGAYYSQLAKGSSDPYHSYQLGLDQITTAKQLAGTNPFSVDALFVIHGESDNTTDEATYTNDLLQWVSDYNTDIKAITGQATTIPMFIDQTSSHTAYNLAAPHSALAQLAAAETPNSNIFLVTPMYFFTYQTNSSTQYPHLTNASYLTLGEYFAKAYKQVIINGQPWTPLSLATATMSANIITATFHVPVSPLQIDTTNVLAQANDGFEYTDDTNSAVITNVAITAPDTVQITLSVTPIGTNPRLRYAYTGIPGSAVGANQPGSARGNIRDSDPAIGTYDNAHLYNWLVHFDKPITVVSGGTGIKK